MVLFVISFHLLYRKAQYFQIVSEMHGKVLDVNGSNKAAGTPVVVWNKPSGDQKVDNQLWYEDQTGVIRSKLNNFALDASGELSFYRFAERMMEFDSNISSMQ